MLANLKIICQFHAHSVHQNSVEIFWAEIYRGRLLTLITGSSFRLLRIRFSADLTRMLGIVLFTNISRTKLLRIYNSLVRSIIEYGCPVWQITPTENMKKLEAIQRKGLSICLGLPATSGREAMEVEGNILPVDLRIEEIEVREIAKIQSKNIAEPVKQQLEEYLSRDDIYEQQESPFGKAINQTVDMFKATKVDIKLVESEVTSKAGVDGMMIRTPSYWSRLGSSKTRTAEQTEESKEVVNDLIGDPTDTTIVTFTDGSCQGSPRPCGSRAVLYPGDNEGISPKRPVAQRIHTSGRACGNTHGIRTLHSCIKG